MKKILLLLALCVIAFTGCTKNTPSENDLQDQSTGFQDEENNTETNDILEADNKTTGESLDVTDENEIAPDFSKEVVENIDNLTDNLVETSNTTPEIQSETEATTSENEKESVVQTVPIEVIDAVTYSRKITQNEIMQAVGGGDFSHTVYIPKVTGDSDAVKEFNKKILDQFEWIANELKAGNFGSDLKADASLSGDYTLVNAEYQAAVYRNTAAITETLSLSALPGGPTNYFYSYYFDADADREITFAEYLEKLNVDYDKLNKTALSLIGNVYGDLAVENAIISENETIAVFNSEYDFGMRTVVVEKTISEIQKTA